jgi:hypothetical protein
MRGEAVGLRLRLLRGRESRRMRFSPIASIAALTVSAAATAALLTALIMSGTQRDRAIAAASPPLIARAAELQSGSGFMLAFAPIPPLALPAPAPTHHTEQPDRRTDGSTSPVPKSSRAQALIAVTPELAPLRRGISPLILGRLIDACAPNVDPTTQAAVVSVESDGDAWVLHDNNDNRSYRPASYPEAVALANAIIASDRRVFGKRDRGLDVGVAQINSNNFTGYRIDAAMMLHPCANLRKSAEMLSMAFIAQFERLDGMPEPRRTELARAAALSIYNSGRAFGDDRYVQKIALALASPFVARTLAGTAAGGGFDRSVPYSEGERGRPSRADPSNVSSEFASKDSRATRSDSRFAHRDLQPDPLDSATPIAVAPSPTAVPSATDQVGANAPTPSPSP